jgi:type I restriction enzyme, S subunit
MADSAPIPHPLTWPVHRLGEFSLKVGSGATPTGGEAIYLPRRLHWALVRSQNVFDRRFSEEGLAYISDEQAARLSSVQIQPRDILLNITGDGITFGRSCEAPASILPAVVNQHVSIIRVDPRVADPGFVLAYLSHPSVKHYIESFNAGGSRRAITKGHIESFCIPLPPLSEQRAIAHILGTLDDKIELNRRMNETLEAMARAIFQSWFVDFDPVRARAEGRDPGLPKHIADLFPDRFENSELGEIPAGWEMATIGDVCEVIDCLHSKKPERVEIGKPLLQLSNIRDDGLLDMADCYCIDDADYDHWISRMEASPGDCVITNVGRVGAVAQVPDGVKAALGRNMTGVWCKPDFQVPTFLIECLLSKSMRNEISLKVDTGTILEALNVRNIPKLRFTRASKDVLVQFERLARPLRMRMEHRLDESCTLATLRDTLLPKLISGELRVKDAERLLSEALV